MDTLLYHIADLFFLVFHSALALFNTFGWAVPKWRQYNLITLLLTAFSWFILGIWHGWRYCACTDWHWFVRRELGHTDMSHSYIDFLIRQFTGIDFPDKQVDFSTGLVFALSLLISIVFNARDVRRRKTRRE